MANYYGTSRTNYFKVTDEKRYRSLFSRLTTEESKIVDLTKEEDGEIWHGFAAYSSVEYIDVPTLSEYMEEDEFKNAKSIIYSYENTEADEIDEEMKDLYVSSTYTDEDELLHVYLTDDPRWCGDADYSFDNFIKKVQPILDETSVFIYLESGNEKLRYIGGFAICASKDEVKSISISSWAEETSKEMLEKKPADKNSLKEEVTP